MDGNMNIVTNGNIDDGYETIITLSKSGERKIEISLTDNEEALAIQATEIKFIINMPTPVELNSKTGELKVKSPGVIEVDLSYLSIDGLVPFSLMLNVNNESQELLHGYIDTE